MVNIGDIDFVPILEAIAPMIQNIRFSTWHFGCHCGRPILILKHMCKTILVAFVNENQMPQIDFHTIISSRGKSIKSGYKIIGMDNVIFLLDEENSLWRLINAFEFSNEKDECLHLIDKLCYYEWVPFKKFQYMKVLEIVALKNCFACLLLNNRNQKQLKTFSWATFDMISEYKLESLNSTDSFSYLLTDSQLLNSSEFINEQLLVTDRNSGITSICCENNKNIVLNISQSQVVSILTFKENKSLMLCLQNGKLVFIHYKYDFKNSIECSVYLYKSVKCIQKCICCNSCLIWSNGVNLHHTNIQFDFDKTCFVKLQHLQVARNVVGVTSLVNAANGFIALTVNNFYYFIAINKHKTPHELVMSTEEILTRIFDGGLQIDALNKEIEVGSEYLIFTEMIQRDCLKQLIDLEKIQDCIVLKVQMKQILRKHFWRVRQSVTENNKRIVELSELECDISQGMVIKIKSDLMLKGSVEVSLVGDFGDKYDLLIAVIGVIDKVETNAEDKFKENLAKIAKLRNPYLK